MKRKKYYAYAAGKHSGIADSWAECEKLVSGVPGARFRGFATHAEAEQWLRAGADYRVKHIGLEQGIYFDAGTGAGNGVEINVADETGKILLGEILPAGSMNARGFHTLPRGVTNNYGELTACKYALEIALKRGVDKTAQKIFGDSRLVVEFWSKGFLKKGALGASTVALADEVKALRREFEHRGGQVLLISGGRNPADLGFHKG